MNNQIVAESLEAEFWEVEQPMMDTFRYIYLNQ